MKILKMEIENFKKLSGVFDFSDVIQAYVGPNGAGKTTLIEAFIYVLTNECKAINLIKKGESKMSVSLILEDGSKLTREKGKNGNNYRINTKSCSLKDFNEYFEKVTGFNTTTVKTVSSSNLLNNITSQELSRFVLSYIPDEITIDKLYQYLEKIPSEIEQGVRGELDNYFPQGDVVFGTDFISDASKYYEEERKLAKSKKRDQKGVMNSLEIQTPSRTMDEVDKELNVINLKKAEILKGKELMRAYESALKNKENTEKKKLELMEKIKKNTAITPDDSVVSIREQITAVKMDMNNINNTAKMLIETNKSLKEVLDNLSKPICPISKDLVCNTDKTVITNEIQKKIEEIKQNYGQQSGYFQEKKNMLLKLEADEKKYLDNETLYRKKELLANQLETLNQTKIELPPKPELKEVDFGAQEQSLMQEKKNILAYVSFQKSQEEFAKNESRIEITDFIATALSQKGIVMRKILEYYISAFEDLCNANISKFNSGFYIKFNYAENELNVWAKNKNTSGEFVPYFDLSSGEKALSLFGLMDMLNSLTGFKILFIDDIDKFDQDVLREFLKIISNPDIIAEYDHILLAGATHSDIIDNLSQAKIKTVMLS